MGLLKAVSLSCVFTLESFRRPIVVKPASYPPTSYSSVFSTSLSSSPDSWPPCLVAQMGDKSELFFNRTPLFCISCTVNSRPGWEMPRATSFCSTASEAGAGTCCLRGELLRSNAFLKVKLSICWPRVGSWFAAFRTGFSTPVYDFWFYTSLSPKMGPLTSSMLSLS